MDPFLMESIRQTDNERHAMKKEGLMAGKRATLQPSAANYFDFVKHFYEPRIQPNRLKQDFRQFLLNELHLLPPTTTMATPSTSTPPSTSTIKPYMSTPPCTSIPPEFEWMHATSTPKERENLLRWAYGSARQLEKTDPDESMRLKMWAVSLTSPFYRYPPPQAYNRYLLLWSHSTSVNAAPDKRKRLFKWKHSALRSTAPDGHERLLEFESLLKFVHPALRSASFDVILESKSWSLQEEILKPLKTAMQLVQIDIEKRYALKLSDTDLRHEHVMYSCEGEPGLYQCQNALWIWPPLIRRSKPSELDSGPIIVAENIKQYIPRSDMIEERPSTNKRGFVTIKLSGKWIAKSIHEMLKDGIDTWAPKLTVKRVIVHCPVDVEMCVDGFRVLPIVYTLMSILEYSKVDVTLAHRMHLPKSFQADGILNRWFPCEDRGDYVVIKEKVPVIIPKTDFENAYKDIFALGYGICEQEADWMVYVTPTQQQVYTELCIAAAKLEGWIPNDRQKTPRVSYVGYGSHNTEMRGSDIVFLYERRYEEVLRGDAARKLGYSAEEVLDCIIRYESLINHRWAVCRSFIEMSEEQGHEFVSILNTRARVRGFTNDYCEEIIKLKKASVLILDKDEGWEKGEERILGLHLLKFTEVLEESCLSVLPHILCRYLFDLAEKFNIFIPPPLNEDEDDFILGTSNLLLIEATDVVMEKCFHLLGISPGVVLEKFSGRSGITLPSTLSSESPMTLFRRALLLSTAERPMDLYARDPTRNFRFELFSFCSRPGTPLWYGGKGLIFGQISATDKFGFQGSHFSEPDVAHVSLFNEDWRNPIRINDPGLVYIGNPSSGHPVSFSRFIEICLELYIVTDKRNEGYQVCDDTEEIDLSENEGYQVCDDTEEIDLSEFWDKKSDGLCGCLSVQSDNGHTRLYYMLLKDAIDTALEIKFTTKKDGFACKVRGYVVAHYGDDFLYDSQSETETICKDNYMALLFRAEPPYVLKAGIIPLIKSVLAVPTKGSLIIKAYMEDAESDKVIMDGCCNFKPVLESDRISGTIAGNDGCSLDVKVSWNFTDRYL